MSLDRALENYHEIYAESDDQFKAAIDAAFDAAQNTLKRHGFAVNNNDPAEDLVSAIVKYVEISRK